MGGSSTPQGANSGNALTNLFLSNQATPRIATSPVSAPQSLIGQGGSTPQMPSSGSSMSPVSYTPSPPSLGMTPWGTPIQPPKFTADPSNPGYGWINIDAGSEHGQPMYSRQYVSAPQQPQQTPYQPSTASLLAAAMNKGK